MSTAGTADQSTTDLSPLLTGLICPDCDYDLRGLTSDRCPECGMSLAGVREGRSRIPWTSRSRRGWYLSFWLTATMVTLRGRALGNEVIRSVDFPNACRFRRIVILHAYIPLLAASIVALVLEWQTAVDFFGDLVIPWWVAQQLALLLALFACTAIPRCFLRPHGLPVARQNRAIALSYYATGVFAWLSIAALVMVLWRLRGGIHRDPFVYTSIGAGVVFTLLALYWFRLLHLTRRTLRIGKFRVLWMAIAIPVLWLVTAAVILSAIPAAVLYVAMVLRNFG